MALRDITRSILWQESDRLVSFRVDQDRVIRSRVPGSRVFVPNETYLEVRLAQMYLRYKREVAREFIPIASFMAEFVFDSTRRIVPFVVGPQMLQGVPVASADGAVEHRNIRVAGPYPYAGEDVRLFAGLYRAKTQDYARMAVKLLETVAKVFDVTKLSSYINVADPLIDGVEAMLGMKDFERRLALHRSYEAPKPDGESLAVNVFQPGYEVLLGKEAGQSAENDRRQFWVIDGELRYGDSEQTANRYDRADFLLIRLAALPARDDFPTLEFHAANWDTVTDHIWGGNKAAAERKFAVLIAGLARCKDLVKPQRDGLLEQYPLWFKEEVQRQREQAAKARGKGFEGRLKPSRLSQTQLRAAAMKGRTNAKAWPADPEEALARVRI